MDIMYNNYEDKGVIIVPNVVADGDNARLIYKGLLSQSGAQEVYAHVGQGESWKNTKDFKMAKTYDGFEAILPVTSKDTLNVVFRDCADNWDNNSGCNYTFKVERR